MILQTLTVTLLSLVLDLLIKEPLVDLYPREARSFHGFYTPFAIHTTASLGKQSIQIRDLVSALSVAIRVTIAGHR